MAMTMAWHGTVIRPVRAGRAGPVWCGVAPARCSRPLELWRGAHKRPGDWQKRKCLASRLLQISSPIRSKARVPRWRRGRAICAESSEQCTRRRTEERATPFRTDVEPSGVSYASGRRRGGGAGGRGHSQEKPRSVASSSQKPALGRAWKLAGVCLAGVRKGGALFHQPSRNSPMKVEPAWGVACLDITRRTPPVPAPPSLASRPDPARFINPLARGLPLSLCVSVSIDGAPKVD